MNEERTRELLGSLADPPSPRSADELLGMHRRRQGIRRVGGGLALAAGITLAILAVGPQTQAPADLTPRGEGMAPADVQLLYAVEGQEVRRGDGRGVRADERVVFQARSGGPGYLCMHEQSPDGSWALIQPPPGQAWRATEGVNVVMNEGEAQAWRPDNTAGVHRYRLDFDPDNADCSAPTASDQIEVDWLP